MSTFVFAGASSAIALKSCELLQQKGHRVIGLTTRKTTGGPYDLEYTVGAYNGETLPLIEEPIDGLSYFPGTILLKPFHRISREEFLNDYEINALGAVAFIQQYMGQLKESPYPSIVLFSSVAAQQGMPFHSSIAMAKSAVEGLVRALAAELAPKIRVNGIAPSLTQTPLAERLLSTQEKTEALQKEIRCTR